MNVNKELTPNSTAKSSKKTIQYVACSILTLNLLSIGMHFGWSSPSLPKLLASDSPIRMSNNDGSWLAVTVLLGSALGSCLAGILLNALGRKGTILFTSIPLFVSWIMIAEAKSLSVLIAGRFFAGLAEGMSFCTAPTYIGEIADNKIRGFLATVLTTGALVGVFIINIMGSYLTIEMTGLIAACVPVITFVTFMWMPESPYFLLMKNRAEQARVSLKILKGADRVEEEIGVIQQFIPKETSVAKYWKVFVGNSNLKALSVVAGIRTIQQCSGATAITFYAQTIFTASGNSVSPITTSSIYFGCLMVITVVSSVLVDKVGRRPLLLVSTLGVGICLLIETVYFYFHSKEYSGTSDFSYVAVVALVVFVLFYGVGLQTIPIVVESEMFDTSIKAYAVCVSDMMFSVIGAIVSKSFQLMKDEFEIYVPFLIFSICSLLGFVFVIFVVPETKGKTLETIQIELVELKHKIVPDQKRNSI